MKVRRLALMILSLTFVTEAKTATTIREIDFENFVYPWSEPFFGVPSNWKWLTSEPCRRFRALNGIHHFYEAGQDSDERKHAPLIRVDSVVYGDLDGDGAEEAIVALNYSEGGTANWDYLYVYKLQGGRPRLMGRMQTGSRADGGLVRTFVREKLLVVELADTAKRVADCCSAGYVRVSYRWEEGAFLEVGQREHGKIDLREGPPRPRFRDYRVRRIYRGKPARPVITGEFRMFRTRIREGAKSDVEFAGHYTIPRWGCGTECNAFLIVDSISGKVYDGFGVAGLPFDWVRERGGDDAIPRMEFYANSRLLKINACPNEENCGLYDYEMVDGQGLKLVRVELLPKDN